MVKCCNLVNFLLLGFFFFTLSVTFEIFFLIKKYYLDCALIISKLLSALAGKSLSDLQSLSYQSLELPTGIYTPEKKSICEKYKGKRLTKIFFS